MPSKRWVYIKGSFDERIIPDDAYLEYFREKLPKGHTIQSVEVKRLSNSTEVIVRIYTKLTLDKILDSRFVDIWDIWEIDPLELLAKSIK